jgi:hypothetical protein
MEVCTLQSSVSIHLLRHRPPIALDIYDPPVRKTQVREEELVSIIVCLLSRDVTPGLDKKIVQLTNWSLLTITA